jgi:DNA-binding CsgD family transcriptional regulator
MLSGLEAVLADCARASSGEEFWSAVSGRIRRLVPYDGACWFGIDPSTLLVNYPVRVENIEPGHCSTYWQRECMISDALLFRDLAVSRVPAGTLYAATGNRPDRSPRYREYLAPQNFDDELRAVFRVRGRTWGVADLHRRRGRPLFTEKDVALLARVGGAIAEGLRRLAVRDPAEGAAEASGLAGTALFSRTGDLISFDDHADHWFNQIAGPEWTGLPPSMSSASAVVSRAMNVHAGRDRGSPVVRLRTRHNEWVTLSASLLRGPAGAAGPVALSVSRSVGWDVAPLLAEAFGLTPREQQACQGVARGMSNKEIAIEYGLSAHTVRDHLKSVFTKVDVASRGELAARLFANIYEPRLHAPDAEVVETYF